MSNYRYYKLTDFADISSYLEISEITFKDGNSTRVAASTITSFIAPDGGTLPLLDDTNLAVQIYWTAANVNTVGFFIKYDMGSSVDVRTVAIGAFTSSGRWPSGFKVYGSNDDSSYTFLRQSVGYAYPGNNTMAADFLFNAPEATKLIYTLRSPVSSPIGNVAFGRALNL